MELSFLFSLDRPVTKDQILNVKCQLKFFFTIWNNEKKCDWHLLHCICFLVTGRSNEKNIGLSSWLQLPIKLIRYGTQITFNLKVPIYDFKVHRTWLCMTYSPLNPICFKQKLMIILCCVLLGPPIYLNWIFPIRQFEILSLMNWILFPVWNL